MIALPVSIKLTTLCVPYAFSSLSIRGPLPLRSEVTESKPLLKTQLYITDRTAWNDVLIVLPLNKLMFKRIKSTKSDMSTSKSNLANSYISMYSEIPSYFSMLMLLLLNRANLTI
eukprot:NODE_45_length_27728_cov_0.328387.p22 type:complete len:115 gc:universal NODE_45_length_27728_cov_0.328387:24642-24986(+)